MIRKVTRPPSSRIQPQPYRTQRPSSRTQRLSFRTRLLAALRYYGSVAAEAHLLYIVSKESARLARAKRANRLVARWRALEAEGHSPAWIEAVIEADIQAETRRLMETRPEFAHDPEGARRAALLALS